MDGSAPGATGNTSAVHVIPRSGWKAVNPRIRTKMKGPAKTVIVHHTALWSCVQPRDSLSQLAHIQNMHMHERGFDDIGYNFLISGDGRVYEGRGWGVVGAHAKAHNFDSVGIAFMGNFNDEMPTSASLTALHGLLHVGQLSGHFLHDFVLVGHRDVGKTECPGEHLYTVRKSVQNLYLQGYNTLSLGQYPQGYNRCTLSNGYISVPLQYVPFKDKDVPLVTKVYLLRFKSVLLRVLHQ